MKNWKCIAANSCLLSEHFIFWDYAVTLGPYAFHLVHLPHCFQLLMLHLTIRQHVMQSDTYSTKLEAQTELNIAEKASIKCKSLPVAQTSPAKHWYHQCEVKFQKLLLKWHYSSPKECASNTAKYTCIPVLRSRTSLLLLCCLHLRNITEERGLLLLQIKFVLDPH